MDIRLAPTVAERRPFRCTDHNECLKKSKRLDFFRHRYATAMFMKWLDEKADLNAMLPYLSAYMGHSNFSDTAYYIHLIPENLLASAAVNWEKLDALIPEVEDEE